VAGHIATPGAHSREILSDWGIPDADSLLADGVVTQTRA
jgi:hypothetical protein